MTTKTTPKTPALTVTELLHQDHQRVRDLFFQFKESEEDEKEELVDEILTELYIHSTVEEEIVYPAVAKEADEAEDLVDEAETEHRVVKFLMAELSEMASEEDQYEAKVTVLCELVGHHIREEEKEMFKKLRESGADLKELAQKVQERKKALQGEPLPLMSATLLMGEELSSEEAYDMHAKKTQSSNKRKKTA